jgi:DNA-binding GntR family transcriptional regulator
MRNLPQLKPVSIRHTVVGEIRRALLDGRFRPGQALSEVALASELNVSRGPVREALLVLAQEGLVTHSQNYGFSVLSFTEADRREVQQVRLPLEVLALELARERIRPEDLGELRERKRQIVAGFCERHSVETTQADLAFHRLIWERAGNSRLLISLSNLLVPYFAYGSAFNIARPDLTPELLDEQHEAYIAFLANDGSKADAEKCVRFHAGL